MNSVSILVPAAAYGAPSSREDWFENSFGFKLAGGAVCEQKKLAMTKAKEVRQRLTPYSQLFLSSTFLIFKSHHQLY